MGRLRRTQFRSRRTGRSSFAQRSYPSTVRWRPSYVSRPRNAGAIVERSVQVEQTEPPGRGEVADLDVGSLHRSGSVGARKDRLEDDRRFRPTLQPVDQLVEVCPCPRRRMSVTDVVGARQHDDHRRVGGSDPLGHRDELFCRETRMAFVDEWLIRQQASPVGLCGDAVAEHHDAVLDDAVAVRARAQHRDDDEPGDRGNHCAHDPSRPVHAPIGTQRTKAVNSKPGDRGEGPPRPPARRFRRSRLRCRCTPGARRRSQSQRSSRRRRCRLAPASPQRRRDATERSRGGSIEGEWIEVGFGSLEMGLACDTVPVGRGHERSDGELGQGHRSDERGIGQRADRSDPSQQDQRARVENPGPAHSDGSITASRSRRSSAGSTREGGRADAPARRWPPHSSGGDGVRRPACPDGSP